MSIKNIGYFTKEAGTSLSRNRLLSIATVSTIAITIFILGVALLLTLNASHFIQRLESDLEVVVFVDKELDEEETADLGVQLKKVEGVGSVEFISRDEALERLDKKFRSDEYDLKETLGEDNPLKDSYSVKAKNPQEVAKVAQHIEKLPGVSKVNYGKGMVERLFSVTKWVRIVSLALIVLLAFGAVFLIATTIRLAIFARRKEIYLMKLIGATDWFIRWPFFIEGIILGALGALIAIGLLAVAYGSLVANLQAAVFFIPLIYDQQLLTHIYLGLLGSGAVLGMLGTWISINRFLDV